MILVRPNCNLKSEIKTMTKIKITQVKSGIDRPERQKLTLRALGLKKINASREVEATAQILGMVRKVNHLITIEQVEESICIGNGLQTTGTEEVTPRTPVTAINFANQTQTDAPEAETTSNAAMMEASTGVEAQAVPTAITAPEITTELQVEESSSQTQPEESSIKTPETQE